MLCSKPVREHHSRIWQASFCFRSAGLTPLRSAYSYLLVDHRAVGCCPACQPCSYDQSPLRLFGRISGTALGLKTRYQGIAPYLGPIDCCPPLLLNDDCVPKLKRTRTCTVQDLYQAWLCELLQYGHHTILLDGDSNQILKAGFPMARLFFNLHQPKLEASNESY